MKVSFIAAMVWAGATTWMLVTAYATGYRAGVNAAVCVTAQLGRDARAIAKWC